MILRLSQKLQKRIKVDELSDMQLDENPYADWSCHLFMIDRRPFIILTNTASLYSCIMQANGINNRQTFFDRALETIREFTTNDGEQFIFRKYIATSSKTVIFAKALNRSVTGSMTDFIQTAKYMLAENLSLSEIGYRLNQTPMSSLGGPDGRKYGHPKEVFKLMIDSVDIK